MSRVFAFARQLTRLEARAARTARHDHERVYRSLLTRISEAQAGDPRGLRVLDFGCGYTYPLLVLMARQVRQVVGVDVAPVYRDGLGPLIRTIAAQGRPASALAALADRAQAARYYQHLRRCARVPVRHRSYRIVRYDGSRLPFADAAFDLVISNAVLQELSGDLSTYAQEIARVLRPGGSIDLEWHNFYAYNGDYVSEEEARRHPWKHLRSGAFHPCLNRKTPGDFEAAFRPHFEQVRLMRHDRDHRIAGVDPDYCPEGESLLSSDLAAELSAYPRELLVTRGFILQGIRRS